MDKEESENLPTHEELMELAKKIKDSLSKVFGEFDVDVAYINGEYRQKITPIGPEMKAIGLSSAFDDFRKPALLKPDRTETINKEDIQNLTIELNREQSFDSFLERV